ncbi:hypothetical protein [Priestia aryabhattai]|uniref:hypothetical protein n=1 Tax=Priestia aryabhattai TaxID=412384 RepID=UPI0005EC90A0|nr:hypothetical protein [Priestia aryabhattai]KJL04341.1 hypothetical protein N178_12475 [Priestia aryabhattai B8W22]
MRKKILYIFPMVMISSSLLISCSNSTGTEQVGSTKEEQKDKVISLQKEINQAQKYISNKEYFKVEGLKSQIYEKDEKIDSKDERKFEELYSISKLLSEDEIFSKTSNLSNLPTDYDGEFSKEVKESREQLNQSLIKDIQNKDFVTNDYNYTKEYQPEYYLSLYVSAMSNFEDEDYKHAYNNIEKIPNNYNGQFAEEISLARKKLKDRYEIDKEETEKSNEILADAQKQYNLQHTKPQIGMTQEEVINKTGWGKPDDINRTTTKYGVEEQWIYNIYGYVYFEDGKVTAIQE